ENAIVAGNASQYWRGDKTWQTLNTSVVPESGNLYFTNARVKAYADTLYLPLNGNAVSATKLQTARNIAGTPFDGTANIDISFTNLVNRPTTLSGYGITDAAALNHTHTFSSLTSKPTTLAGYGITDAANISHSHAGVYEPVFTKNTAFNKNFGTTAGTVSEGNHTHTFASLTSKPTTLSGYGITDAVTTDTTQTISGAKTFSAALTASVSVTTPKVIIAAAGWSVEQSGTELLFKYNGTTKQRLLNDGGIAAIGEVTAYSEGTQAGELTLNKLTLLAGGGAVDRNITSTANTIQLNVGGVTALEATSSAIRRGTTASGVTLGTSTYRWANIYGVDINASTNVTSPKITLDNGWTIEQTSASLTIRKDGEIKGTFNA
ncbi:MAG TPA: hypothetical protein PLR63_07575, partial [Paludibacteraceae bacterium]|nr:hypothetical protein [Paludibacteraceae bacterium]